jgi:cytochrome c-type biogenesis protein CcmH/NrfG
MRLDLQAAREHLDEKLERRRLERKAGPATAGVAAGVAAGLVGLVLFPPLALVAGPLAGVWAAEEVEDSADDALCRAEQQLARTDEIERFCHATSTQLQHAMDLVAATSCVGQLAGFFINMAASADRASRTAGRLEARSADAQHR